MDEQSPRHLKIFVAWPSDVEEERNQAEEVINNLHKIFLRQGCRLEMLDWRKSVPLGANNPEDIILEAAEPETWDVFIGILWKRFGIPPNLINPRTGKPFASGFEAEYQRAHDLWQEYGRPHIMLYRCTRSIPHNSDVGQLGQVQNFFQRIEKHYEVLYKEFDSTDDFAARLENDLTVVIERLLRPGSETTPIAFPHSRLFEDIAEGTDFADRESELAQIQNWLSTDLDASILVHAPSGMGKSRFMERLQQVVQAPSTGSAVLSFNYIALDCHHDEKISTSVEALLLTIHQKLPQPRVSSPSSPTLSELIQAIRFQAVTLKGKKQRLIILLDRIELMSKECRVFVRQKLLPELQNAVYEPLYYPAVIAFGRVQPREWRGRDTVRFRTIELSPFSKGVIKDILLRKTDELNRNEKLNLSFSDEPNNQWAESILKISHGHPRCIVNLVSWLYENHFSMRTDFDSKEMFLSFVMPVIEREILSEDNLAPQEDIDKKSETAKWLRQILPYLCLFRSYSLAELRILVECKVIEDHRIDELENFLRRTFLIDRASSNQASFKPHETIRQLLADAVYYQNPEAFRQIHQTAHHSYHNWIIGTAPLASTNLLGDDPRDFEQVHYIVESLYHYREARRGRPSPDDSPALLERYRNSIRNSARYSRENLLDRLDELLLD